MTTYFGFAVSDSMFAGDCEISRKTMSPSEFVQMMHDTAGIVPCVNPSHVSFSVWEVN